MNKGVAAIILLLVIPLAYSISIKDLISKYTFSTVAAQINLTDYTDYMIDKDNNGLNDTLIIELTANANGNFIFVVNILDKNGILSNETNATFSGAKKLNATFNSLLLSQDRFNYSIKVYNSTNSLKYRKDNILTNTYTNYEEGFILLGISDSKSGNKLKINATINSSLNGTFQSLLFLKYNSSTIYSKQSFQVIKGENNLVFEFDNETIKNTHYNGKYNISSLKIGGKTIKTNYATSAYDFRNFAASSYIYGFADGKFDSDADNNYDALQINATIHAFSSNIYNLKISLYDLFGNIVEIKNASATLDSGNRTISVNINGTRIYNKKLNGPFTIKSIELYENHTSADKINDAYTTSNYNFNDFSAISLPDITINISISDGYHYGINNFTINVTIKNDGNKPAFNVFFDIFDNNTLFKTNKSNMLLKNSEIYYQLNFTNASDFEISAIADIQGLVDESNESNNAEKITIKINKKPNISAINNITANETDQIILNLSASDANVDNLIYSINLSKFSNQSNMFRWQTTTMDSGNYTISAYASDGYLNDSIIINLIVIDAPEKDSDNDGINDTIDKLIGNENSINTSTINLKFFINNSNNLSRLFDKQAPVAFMDGNLTIAEFEFDFSSYRLNLSNITIDKQSSNSTGSLIFRGLSMPAGMTKTLYVDKLNTAINGICVKDDEIVSLSEISGNCGSGNEFKIECDGTLQNSYKCTYNSSLSKYKVEGLKHSGITQFSYSKPSEESSSSSSGGGSGGSGGGGGGETLCKPDWQCSEWTECSDNIRSRKCLDNNRCYSALNKPSEAENCSGNYEKSKEYFKDTEIMSALKNSAKAVRKKSKELSQITGNAVHEAANKKTSPLMLTALGIIALFAGYYLISKHQIK